MSEVDSMYVTEMETNVKGVAIKRTSYAARVIAIPPRTASVTKELR